jgi:hypothetical protein
MIFQQRALMIALGAVMASAGLTELQSQHWLASGALLLLAALIGWNALRRGSSQ